MGITDGMLVGTGFSEEMRNVGFRLVQAGHKLTWISIYQPCTPTLMPDSLFPDIPHKGAQIRMVGDFGLQKTHGAQALEHYYQIYNPDLVMLYADPQYLAPYGILKRKTHFPFMSYLTLDGLPIPPEFLKLVKIPDLSIAITEWAYKEFQSAGSPVGAYCHHGINWNWWKVSTKRKELLRKKYGISKDTTVFISWDVPQYRKRPDALLRCWREFKPLAKDAKLLLFWDWNCHIGSDIERIIAMENVPRETIISPTDLLGRPKFFQAGEEVSLMREIASLGDIYLSTTGGEGFGKCLLEAMSLGMTVIATDVSAVPEVLGKDAGGPYGVLIPTYKGQAGRYRLPDMCRATNLGIVDEEKFIEAMLYYYQNKKERKELGLRAKEWARNFDYDSMVMVGWHQILASINPDVIVAKDLLQM